MHHSKIANNSRISKLPKNLQPVAVFLRDKLLKSLIKRMPQKPNQYGYHFDGVATNNNVDFMDEPEFIIAYNEFKRAYGWDPGLPWRVHQFQWAVRQTQKILGDWVEVGVGRGGLISSALATCPDWNSSNRSLHLFDTFLPWRLNDFGENDPNLGGYEYYGKSVEETKSTFDKYNRICFHVGNVFSTLPAVDIESISFLSIDLNNAEAEEHALLNLYPLLSPGAVVILDDYAAARRVPQRITMDKLASKLGFTILRSPSGQGIFIK